ncbi:hypothetical protein LX32DRAFT_385711 [Colletotrichum zoysiae]|uniref:Uncharacterized protein n=1 Tax=Colletotrichum zoysiae TaxID=1216348 RepID=A0AAD9HH04_9PEZI|nr:hypothetical protein LX32DRAFT_385711 [Colletotrichum zoysiae]
MNCAPMVPLQRSRQSSRVSAAPLRSSSRIITDITFASLVGPISKSSPSSYKLKGDIKIVHEVVTVNDVVTVTIDPIPPSSFVTSMRSHNENAKCGSKSKHRQADISHTAAAPSPAVRSGVHILRLGHLNCHQDHHIRWEVRHASPSHKHPWHKHSRNLQRCGCRGNRRWHGNVSRLSP